MSMIFQCFWHCQVISKIPVPQHILGHTFLSNKNKLMMISSMICFVRRTIVSVIFHFSSSSSSLLLLVSISILLVSGSSSGSSSGDSSSNSGLALDAFSPPPAINSQRQRQRQRQSSTATKSRQDSSILRMTMMEDDTKEFHQLASSAVDLSSGIVFGGTGGQQESSGDDGQEVSSCTLSIERSVRCWDENKRQSYLYRIPFFDKPATTTSAVGSSSSSFVVDLPPTPIDGIFLPSPSGKKTVIIKNDSGDKNDEKKSSITVKIEIWKGGARTSMIEIPSPTTTTTTTPTTAKEDDLSKRHGKIVNDSTGFGVPQWSPDESCIMYVAERTQPTTVPFWSSSSNTNEDGSNGSGNNKGQQYVVDDNLGGQSESWGERYVDQSPLLDLYILNVETGNVRRVDIPLLPVMKSFTIGQPIWHPTQPTKVVFTVWDASQPKRLGMVYCKNRKSAIYEADIGSYLQRLKQQRVDDINREEGNNNSAPCRCLSEGLFFARSPRFCYVQQEPQQRKGDKPTKPVLVFLASDREFVSHDACVGLYRWDETTVEAKTIVPVVEIPWEKGGTVKSMGFPGLFMNQLPNNCRLIDDRYIFVASLWGSFQRIVRINVVTNEVSLVNIENISDDSSVGVVAWTPNGSLIVSETSFAQPNRLWMIHRNQLIGGDSAENDNSPINVTPEMIISFPPIAASKFAPINTDDKNASFEIKTISTIPFPIDGSLALPIQGILLLPTKTRKEGEKLPVIVVPHGGPHSCSASGYMPGVAYLASKYAVLLPNYRGSTGFGQAALDSLLTRIGRVDVDDVVGLLEESLAKFPQELDRARVGICGGSHGGFLTAHCTSQYEDLFKAAAMRNPVTNIASMITSTDIPDWCMAESLGNYNSSSFRGPTSDQIQVMYSKSPVSRVDRVKSPTLVAIGMADLRVPPSQGLEWFHSLKSNSVPTKLLRYPTDNHALDKVTTEADHWIHIRKWFDDYL